MTKKKETAWYEPESDPVPDELKAPEPEPEQPAPLFDFLLWHGILPVYKCATCGACEAEKDDIILHVLTHVSESERDAMLEWLIKE